MAKKLLIKKSFLKRQSSGIRNMWVLFARNGYPFHDQRSRIKFLYAIGGTSAWMYPYDRAMIDKHKITLKEYFLDWQRPTLIEDTAFELETGYSLQKLFRITIPEDY